MNANDPAALVKSDILLQRQNETMAAGSTRNADHILAVANDYRFVDFPNDPYFGEGPQTGLIARLIAKVFRRSPEGGSRSRVAAAAGGWVGVYRSCDRGHTWLGSAVPGSPLDESPASRRSPHKALSSSAPAGAHAETTDPVLVAGPGGRMHLVVLGYIRNADGSISDSRMYYSSYTDRNNLEGGTCITHDYTVEFDRASAYATAKFPSPLIDKPSIAVDKDGTLFVSYTVFNDEVNSKVVIARSTDGGATWSKTVPLLNLGFLRNHGTTTTIDPLNGVVYVAWRLFYQNWPLMVISKSYDRGRTFLPATPISDWWPAKSLDQIILQLKAAKLQPFDQFTNSLGGVAQARSLAFPNLVAGVVNGRSKLFAVWQERADTTPGSPTFGQPLAGGSPRVMFSMSSDGGWTWTPRYAVDAAPRLENEDQPGVGPVVARPSGPQLQPALSISGTANPQLLLFYYEARRELALPFAGNFVSGVDQRLDVRVARINPVTGALLAPSVQVSQYAIKANTDQPELAETAPGFKSTSLNNALIYGGGHLAFFGDYANNAPSTSFEYSGGSWRWASEPSSALTMWTDHRDLQYPKVNGQVDLLNGDWTKYVPVNPFAPADCNFVAMRNANPYFAEVAGVVAGSPQTFKRLTIQRAFVTYVANRTPQDRYFRLTIVPASGIHASFEQFTPDVTTAVTQIFGNSSYTRSIWVEPNPSNPTGSVRLVAEESDVNGQVVPGGYRTTLKLNPDPNNDALTPVPAAAPVPPGTSKSIDVSELHNPQVSAPQVSAFRISAPQVSAPQVSAPQVSAPQVSAPQVSAPQVSAPQVSAPQVSAPQVSAVQPGEPPNGTDVTYTVTNTGNTDTAYNAFLNVPNVETMLTSGSYNFQVLIVRTSLAPGYLQTAAGCVPAAETKVDVLANLQVPQVSAPQIAAILNPQVSAPQVSAIATFAVAPEGGAVVLDPNGDAQSTVLRDEVKVVLRAIRLRPLSAIVADNLPVFNPTNVVLNVASASTNVQNGVVQGTGPQDAPASLGTASPLLVTSSADSGPGSLRQAILAVNQNSGVSRVTFAVPGSPVIALASALPAITSPVILDATTQPGFQGAPIVQLTGAGIGPLGDGLRITAGSSTVRGLIIRQFPGHGIVLERNGGNFIEGNYIGTDATGTLSRGNGGSGVAIINSAGNVIGGTRAGAGNLVSGNGGEGVLVGGPASKANLVAGNFIGTNAAGTSALGNSNSGVYLRRAGGNLVRNNLVAGNLGFAGVAICGATFCGGGEDTGNPSDAAGNILQANVIGGAVDNGGALGNNGFGVSIDGAPTNVIGGGAAGGGNVIAHNSRGVIVFDDGAVGNRIRGNSIDLNGGLGIDLGNNGVTENDGGDADTGPNNYQNFPVLTSAVGGNSLAVAGSLNSLPSTGALIDFYNSPSCNALGHGEGRTWLGSVTLITNVDGNLSFTANLAQVADGQFISATATTADGTSEFSACRQVIPTGFSEWTLGQGGNGHVYEYVPVPGSWTAAKAAAAQRTFRGVAGHLVTISSQAENAIVAAFRANNDLRGWIGLTDEVTGGSFQWVTGEPLVYTNWNTGEPSNGVRDGVQGPVENYVEMFSTGVWNDISDSGDGLNQGYLVEYDVNPFAPAPPRLGGATIASVSPSTGAPGQGFLVLRGTGFPNPSSGIAIVSNGATTSTGGFVFQSPSTTTAYWVRLPKFPAGSATIQLYDASAATVSNAFPITVSATPGTPIITNVFVFGNTFTPTTTVNPGGTIYVAADGIDTTGTVVRFEQGGSITDVTPSQANSGSAIGVASQVTVPTSLASNTTVNISIRQGASLFSAPVTLTVITP